MTASPRSNPSGTVAARLALNTPLAKQLERLPDLAPKDQITRRPLWQRIVAGILLTSSLLVHTGQVLAQYQYGNGAYTPSGAYNPSPPTGYAPNGQLYLAGQAVKEAQAHIDARNVANSVLYNAIVKGLSEPSASNPGFVHDTLGQIDSAAAVLGGGAVRSATVIYFTTTNNIYGVNGGLNSPPPAPTPANPNQLANYNTYKDILTNAPGAGYQTVVAPPNAPNTPAVPYVNGPYLIKTADGSDAGLAAALFYNAPLSTTFEVAQSTQTPTGSSLIGGGVAANLNQDQTQVNHLAALSGGLVFASQAWIDPNNPANNLNFTGDLGYLNRQGQVVGLNMDAANNASSSFTNDSGDASIDRQAWLRHLNQQAKTLDKREGFQIAANSLDLSGYNPNDLFRDGYDLFQYGKNQSNWQSNNDLLRRLQNGQLTPGSSEYNQASQIAQDRYRYAYATRLETNKPLKFSVADAQRKANQLNLSDVDPSELFNQGYDLFQYNPALQPNGAAENALLNRLKNGELTPGSSEYNQATQIAQERLRIAYSVALSPPPPKKTAAWKLIVGAVVGAVLTFVTAGALAPFVLSALTGATVAGASALIAGGFVAGTAIGAVTTAVAGIVAGAIGTLASTTIVTGSLNQGIKAAGNSLVSGSVSAIVGAVIGVGFDFAGLSNLQGTAGTISNIAQNTLSGAVSQTILGNGSFADNLRTSAISSVVNVVSADVAGVIGANNETLGVVGTELAHAALGCATGMIRAQSGDGCVPGATGAVVGHLAAPVIFGTGFDPLGTGTVQGLRDSASFFSGVIGGAVAAGLGDADQVNTNFGLGSAAGSAAAANNALGARGSSLPQDLRACNNSSSPDSCFASLVTELNNREAVFNARLADACGGANASYARCNELMSNANLAADSIYQATMTANTPEQQQYLQELGQRQAASIAQYQNNLNALAGGASAADLTVALAVQMGPAAVAGVAGISGSSKPPAAVGVQNKPTGTSGGVGATLAPPSNTYTVYPRGAGASEGPLPNGYTTVSRWVSPQEATLWVQNQGTAIPSSVPRNGTSQVYVSPAGAPRAPGATGTVRIDFAVPNSMLQTGNATNNSIILQPTSSRPIYNVNIHVPNGTTLPK